MLITVEDVKNFLGITVTTDDQVLLPLCQAAQDEASGYVDYELEGSTVIDYLNGDGVDIIFLRSLPVKSITSIYDDIEWDYGADTLIDSGDYIFSPETGVVTLFGLCFASGTRNVKVTYKAGYNGVGEDDYTNLPYNLKQALIYIASAMYLEGKAGVQVMEAQEIVYRPSYLKKEANKILDKYKRQSL
jgi:uncharacterized phiE125 gp8 family phage protein